ncbi:MAG: polysaccharide pyruvyl transferase family protein [Paraglaciecola sp.]|uniref:polysaccharide pyruvyl transferase family protein n=1 Tax=Paraglaciecola sp. TaxID=1920173 RepID=UPI0032643EA0
MNVLHVASFIGNIGDNASHLGFTNLLANNHTPVTISKLEMRKFYRNYKGKDRLSFDQSFIDHANTFDRVVIGGGGFLDYCIPGSQSGTTIDICPTLLPKLTVPTWLTSIGCAPHHPIPKENKPKFIDFLDACLDNKSIKINVRNDGSIRALHNDIGKQYANEITEILDHGFFYKPEVSSGLPVNNYIAVNISEDQIKMQRQSGQSINPEQYYLNLANSLTEIINLTDKNIVLIPHIYSDLLAINNLTNKMNDFDLRNRVTVAPCIQGSVGANYIFSLYNLADLIIGMRFHTNVCGIAMNKPTIGLQALDRVGYLYEHLGLTNRTVLVELNFSSNLVSMILDALHNPSVYAKTGSLPEQQKFTENCYKQFI